MKKNSDHKVAIYLTKMTQNAASGGKMHDLGVVSEKLNLLNIANNIANI